MTRPAPLLAASVAALLGASCASSGPPPAATAAAFDAIQRQEAIQDEVRSTVTDASSACGSVCEGAHRGCGAADRICAIAGAVTDRDAQLRCEAASDRCRQYRGAADRCSCGER